MNAKDTIITTENLNIGFENKKIKKIIGYDINLNLKQGKLIGLIGANGIGKSTLLKTILRLINPISGNILLKNKPIENYSNQELSKNISIVLTEKLPESNLTVFDIIALGRQPFSDWLGKLSDNDLFEINNAINLVAIQELKNQKHFTLSDGQLQKVLIAKALAQNTDLIIMDEPTTHLDFPNKISVMRLLKQLTVKSNKCIVFSTHDIEMALQICDELIVFTNQKVIQEKPINIIKMGILNYLFDDKTIFYNELTSKFDFNLV